MTEAVQIDRLLPASIERVWSHLAEGERVQRWLGPGATVATMVQWELRPEGPWRMLLRAPDGELHDVGGRFLRVDAPWRLELSWAWASRPQPPSRVIFELSPEGGGTRLRLRHEDLPDAGAVAAHRAGWLACLPHLDGALTSPVART